MQMVLPQVCDEGSTIGLNRQFHKYMASVLLYLVLDSQKYSFKINPGNTTLLDSISEFWTFKETLKKLTGKDCF